jgi:hypothetical protein
VNMTPIRPEPSEEPERPPVTRFGPAQWFWAITISVVFLGPLAVWLYRLAFGL